MQMRREKKTRRECNYCYFFSKFLYADLLMGFNMYNKIFNFFLFGGIVGVCVEKTKTLTDDETNFLV